MNVSKVKTAVIGCGMISNIYIRNLKSMFYIIDLVAVCDVFPAAAEENASFATRMKQGNGIDILTEYDLEGTHYTVFDSAEIMGARIAVAEN